MPATRSDLFLPVPNGNPEGILLRSRTVTVRLMGGLGNQMFQYAAAVGLADRLAADVALDLTAFPTYANRSYQLDTLRVPQIYAAEEAELRDKQRPLSRLFSKSTKPKRQPSHRYVEPHFHFDEHFFNPPSDDIHLDGYFQSPLYFASCEPLIRERFQMLGSFGGIAQAWADQIQGSRQSVSLHVRRGDYVNDPKAAAVHAAINGGYYRRAIALARRLLGEKTDFFLFSDEPDFVQEAFADLPRAHVVRSDPQRSWEDMFLMAQCKHHIIANSSYSWWGAWLNPSPEKFVIAPSQWFTRKKLSKTSVMDLYPEGWVTLK